MARTASTKLTAALLALALLAACFAAASSSGVAAAVAGGKTASKLAKNKPVYDGVWKRKVQPQKKRWARRVAECESGRNPNALGAGGSYRGAFQFSRSTWRHAPRSPGGDPVAFSYKTQAFVAVRLMSRDGRGHWPNCP